MSKATLFNESKKGIYGRDISAIMGLDKIKSVSDVYLDKINYSDAASREEDVFLNSNEAIYWRNTFDEISAKEFSIRSGLKVRKDNKNLIDEEHNFMIGNSQRKIVGENSILMCKSSNLHFPREWDGNMIPASYILEAQHYMRVYKADKCYVASIIGGKKFVYKEILRDEKMINMIIQIEKDFWVNNVLKKIPPKAN